MSEPIGVRRVLPDHDLTTPGPTRADLLHLADRMLTAARRYASPGFARIQFPGAEGGYGRAVDGLEGFARTFLLAGFRLAGARGAGLDELADRYATGIATGTDPSSPERWVRPDEHGQAKVEAASLALILDLTRPWIWDRLAPDARERVVAYLATVVGDDTYPRTNWVWFRLVVQTFLRSVGGPFSTAEMAADLATHDSFRRADGWLSDGPGRAFDHYNGWALHLYPVLWARMAGAAELAAPRRDRDLAALDRFLCDAVTLIGADGSPLLQGRSLTYRFAAAAPFWAGALAGVPSVSPGLLRHAATSIIGHFAAHGAPDDRGLLTLGWHGPWRRLAQFYSGPGSPYWASKGLLGIALPADHPVWTAEAEPLPVQTGDTLRALTAPGWVVSGCRADGIVRIVNHGTDHATEDSPLADAPMYARLGYSTATAPVLDEDGWTAPEDQTVALVDREGRRTHRTGMREVFARVDEAGVAGSTTLAHWVKTGTGQPDYGGGRSGPSWPAGRITVVSLVRGPWELRLSRVDEPDPAAVRLRVGGWAVAGEGAGATSARTATATGGLLTSRLSHVPIDDGTPREVTAGVSTHGDAGPLGGPVRVPWLEHAPEAGAWIATLVELSAAHAAPDTRECRVALDGAEAEVDWPDGVRTRSRIDHQPPGAAPGPS
ncbi:DUF2264 domain-containing protein [Actinoplanes sp. NPDC049599]|uniref:DUF2264 domain-containing protein n=1 Tax=Actinoplanes sp. NPDC049599 TaxID=3363903 RepID=UPI0037B1325D